MIQWPIGMAFAFSSGALTESTHPQMQMNASGEKFGWLQNFDGDAIESISIALAAGTDATTLTLTIEGQDTTANTSNVSGMPDGTAITNGTATVSNKGGTAEWVTFTFGTAPTPTGLHWIVLAPSGGSFDILLPYNGDWSVNGTVHKSFAMARLHTTIWSGGVNIGQNPIRIKKTSGDYLVNAGRPFFSTTAGETASTHQPDGTTCVGVKFVAPYDMTIVGVVMHRQNSVHHYTEHVLVDSSDNELGRGGNSYSITASNGDFLGIGKVDLTGGETYRFYLTNPNDLAQSGFISAVNISSGDYDLINLSAGDWEYTEADDPPAEGGSGTWTDTATRLPLAYLVGSQDLSALSGGGAGSAGMTANFNFL
jgi:hypothetical protein